MKMPKETIILDSVDNIKKYISAEIDKLETLKKPIEENAYRRLLAIIDGGSVVVDEKYLKKA